MAEVVSTNQFKNGMHIELDGQTWRIVEFQHVKPGKGGAFVRTKLKNYDSGAVVDRTFRAGEKFERIRTETKNMQYLYDAGDEVVFMDEQTYEQLSLPRSAVEDELPFMQPSSSVQVMFVGERASGRRPAGVGRARGHGHRARRQGRHGLERDQAGDARDRRRRPGAAVRQHRRQDQGRPAREALHQPRLDNPGSSRGLDEEMYFSVSRMLFPVLLLGSLCTGEGRLRGLLRLSGTGVLSTPWKGEGRTRRSTSPSSRLRLPCMSRSRP